MWPFDIRRRRTIKLLAQFISPEAAEEMLNRPAAEVPSPRRFFVNYLILMVRDESEEAVMERMAKIIDTIIQSDGIIDSITGSLLVAVFGAPAPPKENPSVLCQLAIDQMREQFSQDIKILHGTGEVLMGSLGHETYFRYGMILPDFSQHLKILCEMDFGCIEENNL